MRGPPASTWQVGVSVRDASVLAAVGIVVAHRHAALLFFRQISAWRCEPRVTRANDPGVRSQRCNMIVFGVAISNGLSRCPEHC